MAATDTGDDLAYIRAGLSGGPFDQQFGRVLQLDGERRGVGRKIVHKESPR